MLERIHIDRALGVILAAAVIVCIPLSLVDHGPSLCLINAVTGAECPGCGMTRALMHAAHGDMAGAWYYNWRWVLVAPLLFYSTCRWIFLPGRSSRTFRMDKESTASSARSRS